MFSAYVIAAAMYVSNGWDVGLLDCRIDAEAAQEAWGPYIEVTGYDYYPGTKQCLVNLSDGSTEEFVEDDWVGEYEGD